MTRRALVALSLASLLFGCGGIAVFDDGTGGSTSTSGSTRASTRASSGAIVASSAGVTTGGQAKIVANLVSWEAILDCQPVVAGDPTNVTFTVRYTNVGQAGGSVNIEEAVIGFPHDKNPAEARMVLDGTSSGWVEPGQTVSVTYTKQFLEEIPDHWDRICGYCGSSGFGIVRIPGNEDLIPSFDFGCVL